MTAAGAGAAVRLASAARRAASDCAERAASAGRIAAGAAAIVLAAASARSLGVRRSSDVGSLMARWLRGSGRTSVIDHRAASAPGGSAVRSEARSARPRRATPMIEPTTATATTTRVITIGSMSLNMAKGYESTGARGWIHPASRGTDRQFAARSDR